jgi:uncharacterized repeat protein (TIGR01451 family)
MKNSNPLAFVARRPRRLISRHPVLLIALVLTAALLVAVIGGPIAGAVTASFGAKTDLRTGSTPRSVAVGNFNGHDKRGLAVANLSSNALSILLNIPVDDPPTITAATGLSRDPGASSNSQIATVTDDGGNGNVTVTVTSANPSNGVTISDIVNTNGNVTAVIAASCDATNASFTLQASDGSLTATDTLNVTVNAGLATPIISATTNGTGTQDQACPEQPLTLTATSSGATSFQWYKDNILLPGETNSTYQATAAGIYTATATANGCTTAQSAGYVVQNPTPTKPVVTPNGPTTFCDGGSVTLQSNNATGIQWYKDNVAIIGANSQNYVATTSGSYTAILNALGCHSATSDPIVVTVNPLPATPTITPTPAEVCANSTGNSAAGPAGATTYAWSIVNGTITSATNIQTITYTAGASGTVDLTLVVTNAAECSASNTVNVTIDANPTTPTITPTPAQVCANSTGNSAAGPAGATTYAWSIVNGTITSATNIQTITYTAGASGTVDLTLVVTNASGCSASNTLNVTINANPTPPTITPAPAQVCSTSTGNSAAGPAGASTYAWSIVNGTITSATNTQTITYTAGASGTVDLTLVVTNASGCSASNTLNVIINANPTTPTITPGGPTTFCAGGSVTLTSSSASGNQWSLNGNPIGGATNATYNATTSGSYTVTVTNGNGCSSAPSAATTVTVQPTAITVTNANDSGAGSLRQAIADACPSGTTIVFDTSGVFSIARTITLTSGELSISGNLTISGPASAGVTISGNNASRIFNVGSGKSLLFSNLTIANGKASQGGGILNAGTLTIVSSTLTNNHTTNGANSSGPGVNGGNGGDGGAIYNTGTLKLINSTISGNQPGNGGDASGTDMSGNGGNGGGIFNSGGSVTSVNATITNNKTGANGDNTTTTPSPGPFGNPGTGGGIFTSAGTVILRNTIVAGNFSVFQSLGPPRAFANSDDDIKGAVDSSSANNLVGVDSGMTGISNGTNGNKVGTSGTPLSAGLNPLANNGGPTFTHLPQAGSPVLDAGNNTLAKDQNNNDLTTDQRGTGFDRILNGTVEIGAIEVNYGTPGGDSDLGVIKSANVDQALPDTNITYTITVSNQGPNAASNATLTDPLPAQVTFVSLSSPGGWLCTTPTVGTNGTVSCTNPTLPLTAGAVFTLVVHIVPGATQGNFITNQATVSTSGSDPNDENNSGSAATLVIGPSADLGMTKFANSDTSRADRDVIYTITVSNGGPTAAASVTMSDTLPGTMTFVSLSSPGGWSCTTPSVGSGGTVTCSNSSLALTSGQIFTLVGHIPPGTAEGTFYFNQATVSSSTSDFNTDNNSSSAGTTVVACLTDPVVTTNADSGAGSLRQAISDACVGSTITFDTTQFASPITLTSGELLIDKDLTITGPGANLLTIKRDSANVNRFRIFNINSGRTVNISGVTITGGRTADHLNSGGSGDAGGGINNSGTLALMAVAVSGNRTGDGGSSGFGGNGGGIFSTGTLTVTNSTISGNQTGASAGFGGSGGGIFGSGTLTVTNSTISGNQTGAGGGIGSVRAGGGILVNGGTLTLTTSTITGNSTGDTGSSGGGISRANGTITIKNTIIGGNTASTGPDIDGPVNSEGFNLIKSTSGATITETMNAGTNITGQDPLLNPLADNGGPTRTHLLLPGSPAINRGDPNFTSPPTTDQRGFARVSGGRLDIGAVETNYVMSATAGTPQSATVNTAFGTALKVTVTESGNLLNAVSVTFTAPGSGPSGTFPGPSATAVVATNASGVATAPTFTANSTGGSYNVIASIGPNTPTATFALTNNKLDQTITFAPLADKTFGNPDFPVNATASSGLAVSYAATGNCTVSGAGTGTVHITGAGSCTITASQTGNATYNAAPSISQSFNIAKAASTTAVTSSNNPSAPGQSVTFTATVSSTAGTPTGTVQFKDNGTNLGAAQTLNGSGVAQVTTTTLTAGAHTITADYLGDANFSTSTGTLSGGQVVGTVLVFSASTYNTTESSFAATITVRRIGDTSSAVTVDYATPDDSSAPPPILPCSTPGFVSSRCDFDAATGTLRFAPGDLVKTFDVLISQDNYVEGTESIVLTLSNPTNGALLGSPSTANLVIADDVTEPAANPIDDSTNFVRQHYHDFLNREPDSTGLNFWVNQIESCGADQACRSLKRQNVSAAFYLSIEFQQTGYYVYLTYKTAQGDINPPTVPVPVRYAEFTRDTQEVQRGVIVGVGNWQAQLDANKQAYALAFVNRAAFLTRYPSTTSATAFVDALNANAGNVLTPSERTSLINGLSPNPSDAAARANVLMTIAENSLLKQQQFNRAFVLMEYFGYLRRNPDAAPDNSFAGYNFWLNKLNSFNGDFVKADMVRAFITSGEYRNRFGQ